jgi:hypothetical protein
MITSLLHHVTGTINSNPCAFRIQEARLQAVVRFKDRVRTLTGLNRGVSLQPMTADLKPLLRDGPAISASAGRVSRHH